MPILTIDEIKEEVLSATQNVLKDCPCQCSLIGLGGSYSYGLVNEKSDIDIRGILTPLKKNILLGTEQKTISYKNSSQNTDVTLFNFMQTVKNMTKCVPSSVELLGLKTEHYLYLDETGKELLRCKELFLSKRCVNSFLGYAERQEKDFKENRGNIKKSIEHNKISKSMCNILRLLGMCYDILVEGDFITYREKEKDFLIEIKDGKFLGSNGLPTEEYFNIADCLKNDVIDAAKSSKIPDYPNYKAIEKFIINTNEKIVKES